MDIRTLMKRLGESGINSALDSFFEDRFTVRLGPVEGFFAEGTFRTLDEAADFLDREARIHFPKSAYALGV